MPVRNPENDDFGYHIKYDIVERFNNGSVVGLYINQI